MLGFSDIIPPPVLLGWAAFAFGQHGAIHDARRPPLPVGPGPRGRERMPCARRQPADHQAHAVRVLHLRALAHLDGERPDPLRPALPRHHRAGLLDLPAGDEAPVSAAARGPAATGARPPVAPAARAGMARQVVHARRAGAGTVDFLHQEPRSVRRQEPLRHLFLHRRRAPDAAGPGMAQKRC